MSMSTLSGTSLPTVLFRVVADFRLMQECLNDPSTSRPCRWIPHSRLLLVRSLPKSQSVRILPPPLLALANLVYSCSAVKLAKQVLRDNRQNLALWDGYARIERQRGKVDEARAVYVTALSMYREFNVLDQIDGPLLWRAWAEMEWEEGRAMLALKVLVASVAPVVEEVHLGEFVRASLEAFADW